MMAALGAEVVLVDQAPGSPPGQVSGEDLALVEAETRRIVEARGAFRADQFRLAGNRLAHLRHTGPEIWRQAGGALDAFCDFAGTGGTFAGCAAYFKEQNPAVACYLVEPADAAVIAGRPVTDPNHRIQGGGYSIPREELVYLEEEHIDGCLRVTDEQAIETARLLARREGIFGGFSGGANVAAALDLLRGPHRGGTVAALICDSGLKYLSTDLWEAL